MPLNLRPHEYKRQPNSGMAVLTRLNPYVRLSVEGQPPIFVQDGRYYAAGGDEIKMAPDWVKGEVAKLSDRARKEVGL